MAAKLLPKRAPQPTDKHVGRRIRVRRHMLNITQEALAGAIGVTFQQIQKYEYGTNRVGAGRLQQIADALQCEPSWFFEGKPDAAGNKSASGQRVDADLSAFLTEKYAANVVRGFLRLTPSVKRAIANVIAVAAGEMEPSA
jgi:transcriptional regulator with XRE-family HTH domain